VKKSGRTTSIQPATTVRPGTFAGGLPRHGTPAGNVHGPIKSGYADGKKHRAALRDTLNDK
jgi:hypothetical protein